MTKKSNCRRDSDGDDVRGDADIEVSHEGRDVVVFCPLIQHSLRQ